MDSVSEDNFDIIISMLEEEELFDQVFNDEIAETVQEIGSSGLLHCPHCPKTYKTQNGLTRHVKIKHTEKPTNTLTSTNLEILIKKASQKISSFKSYPTEVRELFETRIPYQADLLLQVLDEIYNEWQEKNDLDVSTSKFHIKVINNASRYFLIDVRLAGLLAVRLRDIVIAFYTKAQEEPVQPPRPIDENEKDGLQKLAGYILRTVLKKAKKSNKTPTPVLQLLQSTSSDPADQKLISVQSRGGLTAANEDFNTIITLAENIFRSSGELHRISIDEMIEKSFLNAEIISIFNSIVEKATLFGLDQEIKNNVLLSILKLFFRVRAFSKARDIVARYRHETNLKKVNKGLRKQLKKNTPNSKVDIKE